MAPRYVRNAPVLKRVPDVARPPSALVSADCLRPSSVWAPDDVPGWDPTEEGIGLQVVKWILLEKVLVNAVCEVKQRRL